jgi:peptide/nickel transport system substrate-binding protein
MVRLRRSVLTLVMAAMLAAGCTASPPDGPPAAPGGTLRVGVLVNQELGSWCPFVMCGRTFDTQSTSFVDVFDLERCCLTRTLLTYNGGSAGEGGTVLRPDMARSLPDISGDGLTWTFHLRPGVHYAPPMQDTEIVAADFIRSFERAMTPAGPAVPWADGGTIGGYFSDFYVANVVEGAADFTAGKAEHVSGLEAPDPHTLVFRLTQPTGDLGHRVAQAVFGPIPANPARPDEPLGVAQGHDFDYGDVLVASGPYRFEGSEALTYDAAPEDQLPPSGDGFTRAVLVRNPSWSHANDPVRAAVADRIELYPVSSGEEAETLVRSGALDLMLNWDSDAATATRWLGDAQIRSRVTVAPRDGMHFLHMNLAVRPFDDVHVRRAMNLAVDRAALVDALEKVEGEGGQQVLTHLALDSYEDNLLISYAPPGVEDGANVSAARAEMALSAYDTNHDGRCDAPACRDIEILSRDVPDNVVSSRLIAGQLQKIGLDLRVRVASDEVVFDAFNDPASGFPPRVSGWFKDFPSATTFLPALLHSRNIGNGNVSMVGATPAQLRRYGFNVAQVPNADARLDACAALVFDAQTRCWAQLDQYLSEQLVPWVPLTQLTNAWLVSERVRGFTLAASIAVPYPALERIRVVGDPPAPPPAEPEPDPVPEIPDGLYRFTLTTEDLGVEDPESTGTFTVLMRGGRFLWHQRGEGQIFNPLAVGRYQGSGDRVTFTQDKPSDSADAFSGLTWSMRGDDIVFTLPRCMGPAAHDEGFCNFQRAFFTAHPWVRIGEASGPV